jgi:hypothetical protein
MKKLVISAILVLACWLAWSKTMEQSAGPKQFDAAACQNSSGLDLGLTNYGVIGPELLIPSGGTTNYLYTGSLWIGGKKYRRNAAGHQLFWLAQHPSPDSSGVIAIGDPGWNINLKPVVDTLTSVGFDGDLDLYELLPAYNPLISNASSIQDLYSEYNTQDVVLKSIQSYPSPLPFAFPDPIGTYCFSIPQPVTGNEPGFETCSAYYYDKCPFGVPGDRDWGTSSAANLNVPLGLAIEQKSFAWPLQNYEKMVVFRYDIHNTSTVDTLFDVSVGYYLDSDVGPVGASEVAADDVSGYVMGDGYEFAYTQDADLDGGLAPYLVGCKFYTPVYDLYHACWTWQVGNGPDDSSPLGFPTCSHLTKNEKYWLLTNRNPVPGNPTVYQSLRGGPNGTLPEYLQTNPNDTRFMYSYYGNLPSIENPDPPNRLHLAPGQAVSFYMILFASADLNGLKAQSQLAETLINNNLNIGSTAGQNAIPYITGQAQPETGMVSLNWFCYNDPDLFRLRYKHHPATEWQAIEFAGMDRTIAVSGLTYGQQYDFKVVAVYDPGLAEETLESQVVSEIIGYTGTEDENYVIRPGLSNYPNPFNSNTGTTIRFEQEVKGQAQVSLYNTRGQKVKTLIYNKAKAGMQSLFWNGRDESGKPVSNGVYYYVLKSGSLTRQGKMLLLN